MWSCARTCGRWSGACAQSGVTIILTTHYIEEAEAIADRVGVINNGELLLVDDKQALMHKLGKRQLIVELEEAVRALPDALAPWALELSADGDRLTYTYDPAQRRTPVSPVCCRRSVMPGCC